MFITELHMAEVQNHLDDITAKQTDVIFFIMSCNSIV